MAVPKAWADLIEALPILAAHQNNEVSPFHCEHDTLTVMANPSTMSVDELARLGELGFIPNAEEGDFTSYRYGSA